MSREEEAFVEAFIVGRRIVEKFVVLPRCRLPLLMVTPHHADLHEKFVHDADLHGVEAWWSEACGGEVVVAVCASCRRDGSTLPPRLRTALHQSRDDVP